VIKPEPKSIEDRARELVPKLRELIRHNGQLARNEDRAVLEDIQIYLEQRDTLQARVNRIHLCVEHSLEDANNMDSFCMTCKWMALQAENAELRRIAGEYKRDCSECDRETSHRCSTCRTYDKLVKL